MKKFGSLIKSRRVGRNWGLHELGPMVGLTPDGLDRIENNLSVPSRSTVKELAKCLELSEDFLLVVLAEGKEV